MNELGTQRLICLTALDLITNAEEVSLLQEAVTCQKLAKRTDRPGWRVVDGCQFLGPARYSYSLNGRCRSDMEAELAERVAGVLRTEVIPVQSNYLYYKDGDYIGLHHDQQKCALTVIVLLGGNSAPLCVHRELVGTPPEHLGVLVEPGKHRGGEHVSLHQGPIILSGGILPHHRDPHQGSEPLVIATFCFANSCEAMTSKPLNSP